MRIGEKLRSLFRRKPMDEADWRAQQEAKLAGDRYRGLKSSQLSRTGQEDAAARGGRGRY